MSPHGASAGNVTNVGARSWIGANATQQGLIRAGCNEPPMPFHHSSFLMANGAGLLESEDMGTNVGKKMKAAAPMSGITLMLF